MTVILYGCNKDEVKDVPTNAPANQNGTQQTGDTPTDQMTFNF